MTLIIRSKNTSPLCLMPYGRLICYQHGNIIVLEKGQKVKKISLFKSIKEKFLGYSKMISRFLRLGIRSAVAIDDSSIILSKGNMLYELNINSCVLSNGYNCGEGIRPLAFTTINGVDGVEDGVYFGGYLQNKEKKPVSIYHRIGVDQWEVVYTFPKGAINHVHNIIPDPYRQCLWIFTGDFGDSAAIWKVTDGFKNVERFVFGNQKWRGCVAFALPEGVLYATDTPFSNNHIYLMKEDGTVDTVGDMCGSCIYGCKWQDEYVFSSTVEADGRDESLYKLMFSKKRGAGIKDDYVRLYVGNTIKGFQELYKEKKDILPYIFQFGAFKFPSGSNDSDTLYFQPVATKKNSMKLMEMIRDNNEVSSTIF